MHEGYNIYTPTFEKVSGEDTKLDLQDLKLINSEGWATETIWLFGEGGTDVSGDTYTWKAGDMTGLDHPCWWDDQNDCEASGVTLQPSEGIYLPCDGTDGIVIEIDPILK